MTAEKIMLIVVYIMLMVCVIIAITLIVNKNEKIEMLEKDTELSHWYIHCLRDKIETLPFETINELLTEIGNITYGDMYVKDFDWYVEICEEYGVKNERKPKA